MHKFRDLRSYKNLIILVDKFCDLMCIITHNGTNKKLMLVQAETRGRW